MASTAIKTVHVFPSFARGGQQARLASIINAGADDFRHLVLALDGDISGRTLIKASCEAEIIPFATEKSGFFSRRAVVALSGLLNEHRADLLCTYNWGAIEAVIANAVSIRTPHIHYEDGFGADEDLDRQKRKRVFARRLLLRKSLTVVPSTGLARLARRRWRLPDHAVRLIPNGVDTDRFEERDGGADAMFESGRVVIGSLGALRPEKNYARLIRAFQRSDFGKINARLDLYGDGPERPRLEGMAAESAGAVALCGETGDAAIVLRGFDIFALSSDTEQMPISVLEAMAIGLPVVAPDLGDIAAMVSDLNRPFITPSGDEAALAEA
ncbi:MAG: glycosyltransferase, partial [Pseudomonadota bacterium]